MKALRWALFIPGGVVLGFLFAFPIIFFYNIFNLDNVFFTSSVKNGVSFYFMALCMAWIAPSSFSLSGFKAFISVLFGVVVALSSVALLGEKSEILWWEYSGEVIGLLLGYLGATQWDKNSLRVLLVNTKGVNPYTSYNKQPDQ